MSLSLTVAGIEYTRGELGAHTFVVPAHSLSISQDLNSKQSSSSFTLRVYNNSIAPPRSNTEVILMDGATRVWAGIIDTVSANFTSGNATGVIEYNVSAGSYLRWFNRHLLTSTYQTNNASEIVSSVVANYCPGFTANGVQDSPAIQTIIAVDQTPAWVINKAADYLSWGWYIDKYKDVKFYDMLSFISPLPLNTLDLDVSTTEALGRWSDFEFEEDGTQVRNSVKIKGFTSRSTTPIQYSFVGDGTTKVFSFPQRPVYAKHNYFPQVTGPYAGTGAGHEGVLVHDGTHGGDGTLYTIELDTGQLPGVAGKAYISVANQTCRFATAPADGIAITGSMYYNLKRVTRQDDPELIMNQAILEGTDGYYEYSLNEPRLSADDDSLALQEAALLIQKYGTPILQGAFTSTLQGWEPGQSFRLKSTKWFGGLDLMMFVTQVSQTLIKHEPGGSPLFRYKVTICDRPYVF